jgi:uncharacterized protein YdhG (YjbR/CyaY superfamily)
MPTKKTASSRRGPSAKSLDGSKDDGSTNDGSKGVDKYLANVSEPARSTLNTMRARIRSSLPSAATEGISYGIPMFKYKGAQVWFAAFSKHCSFFPGSLAVIAAFKNELKDCDVSKGTIRFPVDKPLSATLVKKLVKARIAEKQRKEQAIKERR